jgi:hypothetical protein
VDGTITSYPCLTRASAHAFHPLQPTDELEILSSPQAAGKLISPEESPRALEGEGHLALPPTHHNSQMLTVSPAMGLGR